ncbi:DUF1772-domain-containing protein, partial [Acephala macrosclerotiorum]
METTIRTSQILGLTTSLLLSGINISASLLTLPTLYSLPPSTSTPIFSQLYYRGAASLVPLGLFSASCSLLTAYLHPAQRTLWAIAGVATLSQTPWTLLVMMPGIKRLNGIAESEVEREKVRREEVEGLLRQWTWMNFVRGGMPLVGAVCGLWA